MMKPLALLFQLRIGQPLRATFLLRAVVGWVFFVSGLLKFVYENQGEGRFAKIGFPAPEQVAYIVGTVEMLSGILILLGLFIRVATLALMIDMLVALATTKIPLLFGPGPEPVGAPPKIGFFAFAYQARLDITMLVSCGYLYAIGAGLWSLDAWLSRKRWEGGLLNAIRGHHEVEADS